MVVEAIKIDRQRPRVPEKLLYFTLGEVKQFRGDKAKSLRSVTDLSSSSSTKFYDKNSGRKSMKREQRADALGNSSNSSSQVKRISKDDVERLSRGQPSKRKGYGSRGVPHRLNDEERAAFERATQVHGFVTVEGNQMGYRRTRKGSPLANIHRQWCDSRAKPQILLAKASAIVNGMVTDHVVVDLSPLRSVEEQLLQKYQTDVTNAAATAGMTLMAVVDEMAGDNNEEETGADENEMMLCDVGDQECLDDQQLVSNTAADTLLLSNSFNVADWTTRPIWQLPAVSIGAFEGDRTKAKAMAKELAVLWKIRENHATKKTSIGSASGGGAKNRKNAGAKGGGKNKMKGLSQHRRGRSRDGY
jgi:hypothetical protein